MVVFDWTDDAFFSSTHNQSKPSHSIRGGQMAMSNVAFDLFFLQKQYCQIMNKVHMFMNILPLAELF